MSGAADRVADRAQTGTQAEPLGIEVRELSAGWELAGAEPGQCERPDGLDALDWLSAEVPGTAAAALRAAGLWAPGDRRDFDDHDWWFRLRFDGDPARAGERVALAIGGVATVADIYLNGEWVRHSDSMFAAHRLDVTDRVQEVNELAIHCHALAPLLQRRRRPRARWRTRLVSERNLRFYRTMLLGRTPGFAPEPAAVGPWKPIRLERRRGVEVDELRLRARLDEGRGRVSVRAVLRPVPGAPPVRRVALHLDGPDRHVAELSVRAAAEGIAIEGDAVVPEPALWWPHTHGTPALYEATLTVELDRAEISLAAGRIGFRSLESGGELERDGVQLRLNGVPVFARGAVWTPLDLARPCSSEDALRPVLGSVVEAGMNMLRVPGTGCYEGAAFYDLCDELGILVWQDFMFANLDYPDRDAQFMAAVREEAEGVLAALGHRPSLAVLCGGSEVAQQASMLGLDPDVAGGPLYEELLPAAIAGAEVQAPYLPSAPWGGDLPFRPGRGVANYYGVGAYLRPLEDARRAEVRFAAECLAFSNVPDEDALEPLEVPGGVAVHGSSWKAGVPRDAGAGWDFEDVRDHYLRLLFGTDPVATRSVDPERYLALSRQVTGEVMAEVLGEWRRGASPCGGALVLWLTDVIPGAGWGLLDHRRRPKVAYHHVRRACAPVAVWSTDEGLGGVLVHVANDRPAALEATLRVALYRDFEVPVEEIRRPLELEPRGAHVADVEALLGRFVDASWSYRFGPPQHNLIALSLEERTPDGERLLSQAFRFPAGRPTASESAAQLGLAATLEDLGHGAARLSVSARRFSYGVRVRVPGFVADDDAFSVEPGHVRQVDLRRVGDLGGPLRGHLTALNLSGRLAVAGEAGS